MRKYVALALAAFALLGGTAAAAVPASAQDPASRPGFPDAARISLLETPAPNQSPGPMPAPAPSPSPAPVALRLTEVQFADADRGWTVEAAAVGADSHVWRTTDGGRAWRSAPLGDGIPDAKLDMASAKTGWAVGPADCRVVSGSSVCGKLTVLRTRDGGAAWTEQLSLSDPKAGTDNQVAAVSESTAYVRARGAIWKTTDGGRNWLDASIPSAEAMPYRISFADETVGYAAGRLGKQCPDKGLAPSSPNADCKTAVWKTTDGGKSWRLLAHAPHQSGAWYPADIQFTDKRNGFLLLVNPDTHGSLLYSTSNGGIGWKLRNTKIPGIRPYPVKLDFLNPRVGYVPLSVGAGPVDGGLLRTVNGGASFIQVRDPRLVSVEDADFLTARRGFVVAMNPDNPASRLLLGTSDGGDTWTDLTPKAG